MHVSRFQVVLVVAALAATTLSAQHRVLNPLGSIVDVQARRDQLKHNKNARVREALHQLDTCEKLPFVPAPTGTILIPPHYLSGSHGATNPKEAEAARVYYAFEKRVADGMNQWLATNNQAEAVCAQDQLDAWAKADTLLDYSTATGWQPWFQVGWTLSSIGISESVLINDKKLDKVQQARILAWMKKVAEKMVAIDKENKQSNNIHYWRGLAATAVGVMTSDNDLFNFGVNTFKQAVNEVDQRGALPQEMLRHERSIHYQSFALQPLLLIAAFAERQNVFLYAYTSQDGRDITDAVTFLGDAVAKPSILQAYTPDKQDIDFDAPDFFAAEEFPLARFGAKLLPLSIQNALKNTTYASRLGGSTTILTGSTQE